MDNNTEKVKELIEKFLAFKAVKDVKELPKPKPGKSKKERSKDQYKYNPMPDAREKERRKHGM